MIAKCRIWTGSDRRTTDFTVVRYTPKRIVCRNPVGSEVIFRKYDGYALGDYSIWKIDNLDEVLAAEGKVTA